MARPVSTSGLVSLHTLITSEQKAELETRARGEHTSTGVILRRILTAAFAAKKGK